MTSVMAKGKTIEEALAIKEQDIIVYWETILDDMMFSFDHKDHKEYLP